MTTLQEIMEGTRDTYTVGRVFGDPIEKDGLTIIPVASVAGGGGGGSGPVPGADDNIVGDTDTDVAEGSGGGFGGMARPAGVYVVRGDQVEWQPAVDVNQLGIAGILLGALIAVIIGGLIKTLLKTL